MSAFVRRLQRANYTAISGSSSLPMPSDLGNNLSDYISQPGGQTIVIPAGKTLTGGDISNYSHSDWLLLLAETPGSVTVTGLTRILNCSQILLGGINFSGSVYPAQATTNFVLWYCDITGSSGTAGLNITSYSGGSPGDNIWAVGTNIHDCDHDGIKAENSYVCFQGGRMWHINDPTGVNHDDCYQTRSGINQTILDFVFGMKPDGTGDGNGHTQIQCDLGKDVSMEIGRGWITNSGNYPITTDTKASANTIYVNLHDIYAWDNNYNSAMVVGDGTVVKSNAYTTAPPAGTVAPDVLWKTANPYETVASWLGSSGI